MTQERRNPLDSLFGRLYEGVTMPYNLPLFKEFLAPVDVAKFDAFFATYKANGWHIEEALLPYMNDEQIGMCAFYDSVKDEYKFCTWPEFLKYNGYHVQFVTEIS